jgi:hypothetical protein
MAAFGPTGLGNWEMIHSITPTDPRAKTRITMMLPHRKETPCNPFGIAPWRFLRSAAWISSRRNN